MRGARLCGLINAILLPKTILIILSKKGSEERALEEILDVIYYSDPEVDGRVTEFEGVSVAVTRLRPFELMKLLKNEEFGFARTVIFSNVMLLEPLVGRNLRSRGSKKSRKFHERFDVECLRELCLAVPRWWRVRAIDRASFLPKDLLR